MGKDDRKQCKHIDAFAEAITSLDVTIHDIGQAIVEKRPYLCCAVSVTEPSEVPVIICIAVGKPKDAELFSAMADDVKQLLDGAMMALYKGPTVNLNLVHGVESISISGEEPEEGEGS